MAATMPQPRLIESCYPPERLRTASPGRRLAGSVLDVLVVIVTLFAGWLVWFAIVAPRGQTPGKQLLGMYVMHEDGSRAGGGRTWLREFVVKALLWGWVINPITFGIGWLLGALWCVWDRERQCLWDKIASTYVARSPSGYRPPTAAELRRLGQQPPAAGGRPLAAPAPAPPAPGPPPSPHEAAPPPAGASGPADSLRELRRLRDDGLITDDQFERRRARIAEDP